MGSLFKRAGWGVAALSWLLGFSVVPVAASPPPPPVSTYTGANWGGYLIEVPGNWNGTLVLYSHGYEVPPGAPRPTTPVDAADPVTRKVLLDHGYALAATAYTATGWALEQAFQNQIALLDYFATLPQGRPHRTIAWGHSLGGIITAGLLQLNPGRFDGAIPMCGVVAGGPAVWNQALDTEFAIKTLLAPGSGLQLVNITDPNNLNLAEQIMAAAMQTAEGRARMALVAALGDVPGWFDRNTPEPAATDYATRLQNQYLWLARVDGPFAFALRAELEARAHGNPSWNTDVDYRHQLSLSINRAEVEALYRAAGLSLEDDLDTLDSTPRISADPAAFEYMKRFIVFNGELEAPVLAMHTIGDGLVLPQDEQAYAAAVHEAGRSELLRQVYVNRAGHCTFTPAEHLAALRTLEKRLDTGTWGSSTSPAAMNATAAGFGIPYASAFVDYRVTRFMRRCDVYECEGAPESATGEERAQAA